VLIKKDEDVETHRIKVYRRQTPASSAPVFT
jgi:hypothetical protein